MRENTDLMSEIFFSIGWVVVEDLEIEKAEGERNSASFSPSNPPSMQFESA